MSGAADKFHVLEYISRALGSKDPPTLFLDGSFDGGAYCLQDREIRLGESMMLELTAKGRAGLLIHELGHHEISRYGFFKGANRNVFHKYLLNSIEDCRVEAWMSARIKGAGAWLDSLNHSIGWGEPVEHHQPLSMVFALACKDEFIRNWEPVADLDPMVASVLEATRRAREKICAMLPPAKSRGLKNIEETATAYHEKVAHKLDDIENMAFSVHEQEVQLSALEAFEFARAHIFPGAMTLFQQDKEILNRLFQDRPRARIAAGQILKRLSWKEALVLYREARKHYEDSPGNAKIKDGLPLAEGLLNIYFAKREYISAEGTMANKPRIPTIRGYDTIARKLSAQVSSLVQDIKQAFERQPSELMPGFRTGPVLNMREAMQLEANPRNYDKIWCRRTEKTPEKAAFLLLIDLSGSMVGKKISGAMDGAILMIESLSELATPFAVYGFQDVLIHMVGFDQPIDRKSRQLIEQIPLEVAGRRPCGNNQYRFNDDGPCLEEAAEKLRERPESKKILIVISDGVPCGKISAEDELLRQIDTIEKKGDIHLFGIGIGPATMHVMDYYPHGKGEVPEHKMAEVIGSLILKHASEISAHNGSWGA